MSSIFGSWPGCWSRPRLDRTHRRGGLAIGCVIIAALTACASEPSSGRFTTADSTAPPIEASSQTTATHPKPPPSTTAPWTHDELREELLEMMRQDQLERTGEGLPAGTPLPPIRDQTRAVRLAEIVDDYGWPTIDMVGDEGATAAWLIAQHADHDVELQASWLVLIEGAADAGQADATEVAYLVDRVAVNQQEPQRYGTQIRCRGGVPTPATAIEQDATVDERRRSVGLEPLADYYEELSMMCAQEDAQGQGPAD